MINPRSLLRLVPLLAIALSAGCQRCGQIVWSADGARAAWYSGEPSNQAAIIDDQGNLLAELGQSLGGFAWSADGRKLFYTSLESSPPAVIDRSMLDTDSPTTHPSSAPDDSDNPKGFAGTTIAQYSDGHPRPLFFLPRLKVIHLMLSPDQNWLAIIAYRDERSSDDRCELYAYSLCANRLYQVSDQCALAACFNAANHLVYIQPDEEHGRPLPQGRMVEMALRDNPATAPQRNVLLEVLWSDTFWIQPLGEDLLLTTRKASFPATTQPSAATLFLFTPRNGALVPLAENVGPIFMPSPDGKFILLEQKSTDGSTLSLINANGSNPQSLCKLPSNLPMYPNWRTSEQITFAAPFDANSPASEGRTSTEVIQYKLLDGRLQPLATLSTHWPQSLKPTYRTEDFTTTRPSPSTQP
ncbi:MAG: PD40 domain-containing protein [Phycisphaerales bacterium]|nr:PD40 domain-containing protein [Phycisphaerales bacterium]